MSITIIKKAAVGRMVHVIGSAAASNGATVAPAVITRVWGEPTEGGKQMVNLTLFPDNAAPKPQGSVQLYSSPQAAHDAVAGIEPLAAYWPEQV